MLPMDANLSENFGITTLKPCPLIFFIKIFPGIFSGSCKNAQNSSNKGFKEITLISSTRIS
jgi:hypothetical protein